ncbi:unnamed protein product [Cuscuta campestris]|uniref:Uncharacterized protein n=1 Tax=Cuscuta campestris TaxID=132261 RepID=A0A484M4G8_9ASTE|nr:unnamed protein product [Cuscuta campestris]
MIRVLVGVELNGLVSRRCAGGVQRWRRWSQQFGQKSGVCVQRAADWQAGKLQHSSSEISLAGCTCTSGYHSSHKMNPSLMADNQIRGDAFLVHPEISQHFFLDPDLLRWFLVFPDGFQQSANQEIQVRELGIGKFPGELQPQSIFSSIFWPRKSAKNEANPRKSKARGSGVNKKRKGWLN